MITSGKVFDTFSGFLLIAAVARFGVKSKALVGLLETLFANFFDTFNPFYLNS